MWKMATATALVLATAGQAKGDDTSIAFYTGNDLLRFCQDPPGVSSGICMGFIAGITDALSSGSAIAGWRACIPHGVTVGQVKDVAIKYLAEHSEGRHYSAVTIVSPALAEAFPCK